MEQSAPRKQTSLKTLRALLSLADRYGLQELHCNGVYLRRGGPVKPPQAQPPQFQDEDDFLKKLEAEVMADTKRHESALSDQG
jgi:hypothetical protein